MSELTPAEWSLVLLAGFGVGVSKSGFVGVGLFHVVVFAFLFGAKASTGVVLPMLALNAVLTPMIVLGLVSGRWLIHRIPQRLFDSLVLAFSAIAALRLIGAF